MKNLFEVLIGYLLFYFLVFDSTKKTGVIVGEPGYSELTKDEQIVYESKLNRTDRFRKVKVGLDTINVVDWNGQHFTGQKVKISKKFRDYYFITSH